MARFYGDTNDWRDGAEHHAEQTFIGLVMADCRYCKTAQKKARAAADIKIAELREQGRPESMIQWVEKRAASAGCRKHREEQRLAFVTSPVSETYWAS